MLRSGALKSSVPHCLDAVMEFDSASEETPGPWAHKQIKKFENSLWHDADAEEVHDLLTRVDCECAHSSVMADMAAQHV